MSNLMKETVTSVHHWNDTLFSFKTSRDPGFRFKNGHFVMIGLESDGKPLKIGRASLGKECRSRWSPYH